MLLISLKLDVKEQPLFQCLGIEPNEVTFFFVRANSRISLPVSRFIGLYRRVPSLND